VTAPLPPNAVDALRAADERQACRRRQ
jgi:hypothetical protein